METLSYKYSVCSVILNQKVKSEGFNFGEESHFPRKGNPES